MPIPILPGLVISEDEIIETYVQAGGPGGQNVNKVATAVQLRFDAGRSPHLSADMRARLRTLAGRRMTQDGVVVIDARRHRTQERNRADALERLVALLRQAAVRPTVRRPTRPTRASVERRLEAKTRASVRKATRRSVDPAEG